MTDNVYPMYLVDDYPDGAIEERAWVQVTSVTATGRAAEEWLQREMPIEEQFGREEGHWYRATGERTHQRPAGHAITDKDGRSVKPLDEYPDCTYCKGTGKVKVIDTLELNNQARAKFEALPRLDRAKLSPGREIDDEATALVEAIGARIIKAHEEECDECIGTGKDGEFMYDSCEPIPWEACEEEHPEAMEFWVIEVTDESPAPTVSEHQGELDL